MRPSVFTSAKGPPLCSTTVLRPPLTTPQCTAAGYSTIRLDTYHDTSDLREALRKIEAAFMCVEQEAAGVVKPAAEVMSSTADPSTGNGAIKGTADVQLERSDRRALSVSTILFKKNAATASMPPRRGLPVVLQLSPQLVIYCFSFCNLQTLSVLCRVSVRMNVLLTRQGDALWLAAAQRRRIPIEVPACAREELRKVLLRRARERNAEEAHYEAEIARMEQRLSARAQEIYAQNVDVDFALRTSGAVSTQVAANTESFGLRQQRIPQAMAGAGVDFAGTTPAAVSQSAEMYAKLQTEIEALEEMKRACECRLNLQEELLLRQDAQLLQWQSLLLPCKLPKSYSPLAPAEGGAATAPIQTEKESADAAASLPALVSAAQVDNFERRIARLVLNGPVATSSAAITDESPGESSLPVVLRRGVENFASLELVLRAVGNGVPVTGSSPANADAVLASNAKATATAAASDTAVRAAVRRWNAYKKICPTNEEYQKARLFLKAQVLRTVPGPMARVQCNTDGHCSAKADAQLQQQPSVREMPALIRLSGFVRRVEAMSDAQVLQEWM
ncbi:hypothetical protein LPMP_201270 [Leishmania panamensis]|uniref:F-box domain-containing protein n=1 Tax=Leishmania panamensis TaxID=5679 RepID=A0A088S7Q4_LEIPA|nr:hypothetical protein LPMP_201270 [Leishmania panamensis]AIN97621.1 hypothetical protein LPMP_201270 [Leishmania panamensis]